MSWKNVRLVFLREVRDQLRDRRTLFMITILPVLLYPLLGLGLIEMMLTFSEQRRTIVVLQAAHLPAEPAFLTADRIDGRWLGDESGPPLTVITDRSDSQEPDIVRIGSRTRDRADVLRDARTLAEAVRRHSGSSDAPAGRNDSGAPGDLSTQFRNSGIDALIVVPPGYADAVGRMRVYLKKSSSTAAGAPEPPPPLIVVRNSADDRSVMAFSIVQSALRNWEAALRESLLQDVDLPRSVLTPARLQWVEVADGDQVSANIWSKLIPALLVVMTLTGAFYPAVDLGAGEKERGTMETLLISPARRIELVLGKFLTVMLFSIGSALMNLASMAVTGRQMASAMGAGLAESFRLQFPPVSALIWVFLLLLPLAALFSALCLALATFARSTKEGQYYLTPLLMVVMGLTLFCLSPTVQIAPMYSVLPVVNVALLLKGLLAASGQAAALAAWAIPVLVTSIGYSILALWWAIDLYNNENVLFRESEKFELRAWLRHLMRPRDAVPAFSEAVFCFIGILLLQWAWMNFVRPDLNLPADRLQQKLLQMLTVQQLVTIACPAVFMGILLTTSPRATFRLRRPAVSDLLTGVVLAVLVHPLSVELNHFLMEQGVFPELPEAVGRVQALMASREQPLWVLLAAFAVVPGICEELAFRGFILSGLARGGRLGIAIVLSSMMFGAMHMIPQQVFNTSLLGLLIGLLAVRSRSLFPVILFHITNNVLGLLYARSEFLPADGLLFTHDGQTLRYRLPLLLICSVLSGILTVRMIRDLVREQEARRRGKLRPYTEPTSSGRLKTAEETSAAAPVSSPARSD